MKTNHSTSARKAKKKAMPPQPAMFRIHCPVTPARVAEPAKADGDKKEAKGGAKPEPPAVTSIDVPIEKPNARSTKKTDDVSSMDQNPPAEETKGKEKKDNESDKDSITGEINEKSPPQESCESSSPNDFSHKAPKDTGNAAKYNADLFADSDGDDEPKFKFPRTAIKRPRNSASAEAYAKRMAEKEEAERNKRGNKRGVGAKSMASATIAGVTGEENLDGGDENPAAKKGKKSAKKGKGKKKSGEEAGEGHVKMKHTPKVPNDAPPRKKSSRGKKAAASAVGNLKSPPEEIVHRKKSSRTKKPTEKAAFAAGLKFPPEAKLPAKEKDTESDEKPEQKSSPRRTSRSASKSKANTDGQGEAATATRRSTKKPTEKAASAAGLKSPPEAKLSAKEKDTESDGQPEKKSSPRNTSRSAKKSKAPADEKGEAATGTRRSKRNTSVVAEELVSNLEEATNAQQSKRERDPSDEQDEEASDAAEEATTARRSKRARKPSFAAEEMKKNEAAAMALEALQAVGTKPTSTRRKSPGRKSSPRKAKAEASDAAEEQATTARRPKRSRKPSFVAKERKKNEPEAMVLEAVEAVETEPASPRLKSPPSDEQDEGAFDADEEATTARRSKRARKPSFAAKEMKMNEAAAMALEAADLVGTESWTPKRKSPAVRKSSPREATPAIRGQVTTWETRITMLKTYKELYNTCDLTHAPAESVDSRLRNFVLESRKQYKKFQKGKKSSLTAVRIAELRALGFDFCPLESGSSKENHHRRFQKKWDEQFLVLEAYKAEHGDCLVSCVNSVRNKLGNWVRGQRKLMNKVGREGFDPLRLAKLDEIGFDFDPVASGSYIVKKRANMFPRVNANWEKHYKNLNLYRKEHGNIIVGPNTVGWPGLYDWIHSNRKEYKKWQAGDAKAAIYDTWIAKLNEVAFDWAPMKGDGFSKMMLERQSKHFNDLWHKHYGELETFKKKNGHCYVYRNRSDANQTLAGWIHHQRKYKRKHDQGKNTPLTDERIKLLTDIGLDWNPSLSGDMVNTTQADRVLSDDMDNTAQADRDKEWEALFEQLCTFKEKNGHANPEEAEPQLGSWACQMREFYSQNASGETTTLTDAKIAKLESVGFRFATGV